MKAWQYRTAAGGLEKHLYLPAAGVPKPTIHDNQILVEVYSAAINPADYKFPEMGIMSKVMVPSPSIPGFDFCGKVAAFGSKIDSFQKGEMVFGSCVGTFGHGSLAQYIAVSKDMVVPMPEGIKVDDAASLGTVAITAYQALKPHVKEGSKVFVNGGSGGTGVFTIQVAKALGCHVTTSCSEKNIDFCKGLGADDVLDYKASDIIKQLESKGQIFDLVVDNIGKPSHLYKSSHSFIVPHGRFIQVGTGDSFKSIAGNVLTPGFLGGGKRKYQMLVSKPEYEGFVQIGKWMKEGKIHAVIDSTFEFDEAPKAFEKLKTGRSRGKIVVHVKEQ